MRRNFFAWVVWGGMVAGFASAARAQADPCPMRIEVTAHGDYFTNRFYGHYRTSATLLKRDLAGGCYNDSHPAKVSSVTVFLATGAPKRSVASLYKVLAESGWPRERVTEREGRP